MNVGLTAAMLLAAGLMNVAGVGGLHSSLVDVEPEEWAKFLNVNLTASWRLIRSLDPLLRLSEAGRTIFVTSGAVRRIAGYRGPYAVSKAALEMLVKTYAAEIAETRICANLVDPGPVRTQRRAQDRPEEDPMTLTAPEDITEVFVDLAEVNCAKNGEIVLA